MWGIITKALSWLVNWLALFLTGLASKCFNAFGNKFQIFMQGILFKVFAVGIVLGLVTIGIRIVLAVFCIFFLTPERIMTVILYVGGANLDAGCSQLPPEVCPILAYAGIDEFINKALNLFWRVGWFLYILRAFKKIWIF